MQYIKKLGLVISYYSLDVVVQSSYEEPRLFLSCSSVISEILLLSTWCKIIYYQKHFAKHQDVKKVAGGQTSSL